MSGTRILIFAKAPAPGKVKTRLIPALGDDGAARIAQEMLEDTVAEALAAGLGMPELCGDPELTDRAWDGLRPEGPFRVSAQGEGDLGARLERAAQRTILAGESVLLVGTDCPGLDAERLAEAARQLGSHDAVIYPAEDGGYVLLGLGRHDPSIFAGIAWSGPTVVAETIARIRALGWSLHIGETLRDIDEPADLIAWEMDR